WNWTRVAAGDQEVFRGGPSGGAHCGKPHFAKLTPKPRSIEPGSRPIFASFPPRRCKALDNASGWVSTTPRHTILPASSTTHRRPLETNVQSCKHPHRCSPSFARGITSEKGRLPAGEQQPNVWDVSVEFG